MKTYPKLSKQDPIDPSLKEWTKNIPEKYLEDEPLMDCLYRFVGRIKDNSEIADGVNPFYKVIELLSKCEQTNLQYEYLQTLDEYYHLDIINYLTEANRGEFYTQYPCNNKSELKRSLNQRNNKTSDSTLRDILANMI